MGSVFFKSAAEKLEPVNKNFFEIKAKDIDFNEVSLS